MAPPSPGQASQIAPPPQQPAAPPPKQLKEQRPQGLGEPLRETQAGLQPWRKPASVLARGVPAVAERAPRPATSGVRAQVQQLSAQGPLPAATVSCWPQPPLELAPARALRPRIRHPGHLGCTYARCRRRSETHTRRQRGCRVRRRFGCRPWRARCREQPLQLQACRISIRLQERDSGGRAARVGATRQPRSAESGRGRRTRARPPERERVLRRCLPWKGRRDRLGFALWCSSGPTSVRTRATTHRALVESRSVATSLNHRRPPLAASAISSSRGEIALRVFRW